MDINTWLLAILIATLSASRTEMKAHLSKISSSMISLQVGASRPSVMVLTDAKPIYEVAEDVQIQ